MADEIKKDSGVADSETGGAPEPAQRQALDRRGFLKKGAAVGTPVILTLASRPVWAARNCALSGQLSGNLSDELAFDACGGEGCSPGYWKTHTENWHYDYPPTTPFADVFPNAFPGMSLYDVICLVDPGYLPDYFGEPPLGCSPIKQNGKPDQNYFNLLRTLGFHSVAALQNSATSVSFDLEVWEVVDKFTEAWESCDKNEMQLLKDYLDDLNNQFCPF